MRGKPVSYRARKACREEYKELRARLGRLKDTEWQQAGRIMGQIAATPMPPARSACSSPSASAHSMDHAMDYASMLRWRV